MTEDQNWICGDVSMPEESSYNVIQWTPSAISSWVISTDSAVNTKSEVWSAATSHQHTTQCHSRSAI